MEQSNQVFHESSIGAIEPSGWLRRWLELQKHGLTGNCEVAGFPFDSKHWACPEIKATHGAPWWPYEQTAYLVDGYTRCGYLLRDPELMAKAQEQMDYVLEHADKDGYLGPDSCKPRMSAGRWSHMIFFRAMIAHYQATGDARVVKSLTRHYLGSPLDHGGHRDVCNIEIMIWLSQQKQVSKKKQEQLIALAEETYANYLATADDDDKAFLPKNLNKDEPAHCHGVTFCETAKQGALLYVATGKRKYLKVSLTAFNKIDKYHMLIDGVPSSHEGLEGQTAKDPHETCDIADYTWSAGHMLMITGNADWADKIERACFNAAPGAVTKDFKALQYFSGANQVVLARNSAYSLAAAGTKFMCYRPKPGTECCTGEVNRIMPNYVARMWMMKEGEPCSALYGPSTFRFETKGQEISIHQETFYPFSDRIDFRIDCKTQADFGLWLRIPAWCDAAALARNGKPMKKKLSPGQFVRIRMTYQPGDRISLTLPMSVKVIDWPAGGTAVERGPLLYALKIDEEWQIDKTDQWQSRDFPAWELSPKSSWNYALDLPAKDPESAIKVSFNQHSSQPFTEAPVELRVPARRVSGWRIAKRKVIDSLGGELIDPALNKWRIYPKKVHGDFILTPDLPGAGVLARAAKAKQEIITLVPYGCTLLRIALFPRL